MKKYIALLRGINVSGHKIIKMEKLREALTSIGLQDVQTYIQSGNIIFDSEIKDAKELEVSIYETIKDEFGFEVATFVLSVEQLLEAKSAIPSPMATNYPPNQVFIIFLDKMPEPEKIEELRKIDVGKGEYFIDEKLVIFGSSEGFSGSKMNTNFFENKLKVSGTARNLKTLDKLIELSKF